MGGPESRRGDRSSRHAAAGLLSHARSLPPAPPAAGRRGPVGLRALADDDAHAAMACPPPHGGDQPFEAPKKDGSITAAPRPGHPCNPDEKCLSFSAPRDPGRRRFPTHRPRQGRTDRSGLLLRIGRPTGQTGSGPIGGPTRLLRPTRPVRVDRRPGECRQDNVPRTCGLLPSRDPAG